jgi:DNA-binding response OmpR family regulator
MRILLAEDDAGLRSVLERGLREDGFVVDAVGDGEVALRYLNTYEYSVVILDWRMPGRSGVEVVQDLRQRHNHVPVLLLTARDTTPDRVLGLDAGADDYLVKPFDFAELRARLRALLRRPTPTLAPRLGCGDLLLDTVRRSAAVAGTDVVLTATEFSILEVLCRSTPSVVRRQAIATNVWHDESDALGSNTIDVHVGRLRSKLSHSTTEIQTVRGIGYRLVLR